MKLQQMRAFHQVMLTGSVSAAARNLHRTQPGISAAITSLEKELGMALFERSGGRLHPVPEAHYLQEEFAELLQRVDNVRRDVSHMQALEKGEIRIVSMPGPSVFVLPALIARLADGSPDLHCALLSRSSDMVGRLVSAQQFDIGVADSTSVEPMTASLVANEMFEFECVCAVPADSPLAERAAISPADLEGQPLAALYPEHDIHRSAAQCFFEAGVAFRPRFITQYFIPLLTFVEQGLACAIVDPLTVKGYRLYRDHDGHGSAPGVVFRAFTPRVSYSISILTPAHRPASLITQAFKALLIAEFIAAQGVQVDERVRVIPAG